MSSFLLLILLSSLWVTHVTHGCETGTAFVKNVLSVPRSLMANADVALLKAYNTSSVQKCMEDCCSGTYGACSVASFKKNSTQANCLHFYCRPLNKCRFTPSNSTDSFSFSNNPPSLLTTLSSNDTKSSTSTAFPPTREVIAIYPDEGHKNDNTTIQPRKGVEQLTPDAFLGKSGIKPRKGVSIEDVPHSKFLPNSLNKSNVKPRKGVEPFSPSVSQFSTTDASSEEATTNKILDTSSTGNAPTKDFLLSLEKVFEDDPLDSNISKVTLAVGNSAPSTSFTYATSSIELLPSETTSVPSTPTLKTETQISTRQFVSEAVEEVISTSTSFLTTTSSSMNRYPSTTQFMSVAPTQVVQTGFKTAAEESTPKQNQYNVKDFLSPNTYNKELYTQEVLIPDQFREEKEADSLESVEETENERRYKSSIHLVLALVFGLLVLFAVLGVVAKRVYDGWIRRDYHRMNYLIDGIYNGMD